MAHTYYERIDNISGFWIPPSQSRSVYQARTLWQGVLIKTNTGQNTTQSS